MKHLKKISVLAAVLVMVSMILASCGGGGLKGDPAVGTWEMTEVEYAGQTLSADDLKSTGQMDGDAEADNQGRQEPAHSPSWMKMGKVLFPLEKTASMICRMIPIRF